MDKPNNRLPKSPYKAEYPFNQTTTTRSGHEFHVDDTPGAERLRTAHKSGTFFEVSADGRKVELVVGDQYHYVKGGLTLTVDNNGDILFAGNLKMVVQGDLHAEVFGDLSSVVSGDSTITTLGDSVNMIAGDALAKVEGSMSASVDKNLNVDIKGDAEMTIGGDVAINAEKDVDLYGANVRVEASDILTLKGKNINMIRG